MVDATKQLHGPSQGLSFDSYQIPRSLWIPQAEILAQELAELDISQSAIKRICKQVVLKNLEAHEGMIRSYYAAKFNPATTDFSSTLKDAHLIQKILQKH